MCISENMINANENDLKNMGRCASEVINGKKIPDIAEEYDIPEQSVTELISNWKSLNPSLYRQLQRKLEET